MDFSENCAYIPPMLETVETEPYCAMLNGSGGMDGGKINDYEGGVYGW